jgi:hypothetical protein
LGGSGTGVDIPFDLIQNQIIILDPSGTTVQIDSSTLDSGDVGQSGLFILVQPTDARTVTWTSAFKHPGGTAPTLSSGADKIDVLPYFVKSATEVLVGEPHLDFS